MNNIQLNIVANAQFQQVYAEVAKLKGAMASLQKMSVGGPFAPGIAADIRASQSAFDSAILSTRAFTIQHVAMTDSVTKFGKQLAAGQLNLNQYYKIWRESAKGVSTELDLLAKTQARLNRSIAIADPLRPGYAKLVTDINGLVTAQEKAIFYQKALNTALHDGAIKVINFGKNTQWMGRQLTVGLTMPMAMFGVGVSNVFKQVDQQLTRMQKVYGTGLIQPTQAALNQIRSDVQVLGNELARTLGTSMQDTAAMAADLAATGLEGTKLLEATREAIRLATLGELDHQQAMQTTVSLQNVYKLSTQELSNAVNFLNAVENQTSTSLQDLVDSIPRVGPIVKQLGGDFKDTAAMMVAMKEAGVPAAQGANAIKSALASLINPTKNAQEAFMNYRINLRQMISETGGKPIEMLRALADQMKGLDRVAQAQLIEKMFGKYQFARIQALIDNINKAGSQTQTVFGLMGASSQQLADLASKELKTQTESASGRFKRMVETLKADLLPIGESFLNSFTKIGNIADKMLRVFQSLGHVLGPVSSFLGKIFGGGIAGIVLVGPILMLIGLFANLTGNLLKAANYMRMFKQGMDNAGTSQNRFSAGLQNMRNFYENLDVGMIAARNQLELMPEAITSNARAFEILTGSIRSLTLQFEALAAAQAQAMGMPMGGIKSPLKNLPKMATGGIVPGTGNRDTYAAMLTPGETVIPKEQSKKYGSLINSIISNQVPGYSKGLFATESGDFMDVTVQKLHVFSEQSGGILSALTSIYERLVGPTRRLENLDVTTAGALMGGTARLNQLTRRRSGGATPEDVLQELTLFPQLIGKGGEQLDPMSLMKKVASKVMPEGINLQDTYRELDGAYGTLINRVRTMSEDAALTGKKIFGSQPGQRSFEGFVEQILRERLGGIQTAVPGPNGQMSLADVLGSVVGTRGRQYRSTTAGGQELHQGTGETFWRDPMTGQLIPYSQSILKTGFDVPESAVSTLSGSVPGSFGPGQAEAYAGSLGKRLIQRVRRAVRANSDSQEAILVAKDVTSGLAHGLQQNAPMVETSASQLMTAVQQELDLGIPKIASNVTTKFNRKVFIPLEELAATAGRTTGNNFNTQFHQMMLPGMGGNTFLGMPGRGPEGKGYSTDISRFGKFKNFAKGPGGMMGMSMLAPLAIGMIPDNLGGKNISDLKSTTQSAIGMGSMAGMTASMMGLSAAGPIGLAVGGLVLALGGLQMAFKNSDEAARKASEAIVKNYQTAADQINAYRIDPKADKTAIELNNVQLITYDSTKKLTEAQKEAAKNADKLKTSFDNISKASTLGAQVMSGQGLGTAQNQAANTWGNKVRGFLFGRYSETGNFSQSVLPAMFTTRLLGQQFSGLRAKDQGYYQAFAQSQLLGQLTAKPKTYGELIDPNYLVNLDKAKTKLNEVEKATLSSKAAFTIWNDEIKKSNPVLADVNNYLEKHKVSMQNIIQLNQAYAAGFFLSTQAMKAAANNMSTFTTLFKDYQEAIQKDTSSAKAELEAAQKAADAAHAAAAKAAAGDTFTKDDELAVKSNEKKIKTIQEEMKARDDLYNAQLRNIDAQQQQMNLEAEVVKARGSGDLIKMAIAQQNLQVQRTKDAMARAKSTADTASQAKIDALQKEIDKLNEKKSGTSKIISTKTEDDRLTAANEAYTKAMSGLGANAQAAIKAADKTLSALFEDSKGFWTDMLEKIKKKLREIFGIPDNVSLFSWEAIKAAGVNFIKKIFGIPKDVPLFSWEAIKTAAENLFKRLFGVPDLKTLFTWNGIKTAAETLFKLLFTPPQLTLTTNFWANIKGIIETAIIYGLSIAFTGPVLGTIIGNAVTKIANPLPKYPSNAPFFVPSTTYTKYGSSLDTKEIAEIISTYKLTAQDYFSYQGQLWNVNTGNTATKAAYGGFISKFDIGGKVIGAGTSRSDSIPAMLSNGEYVIQADSVSKYGKPFMDAINNKTYSVPLNSLRASTVSQISDAISNSTNYDGNTINVYAPAGANPNEIANMVLRQLDMQRQKQITMRRVTV